MAGAPGTEDYNAAGNSDFSRKAMELIEAAEWMAPVADDTGTRTKRYGQGGMALSMQSATWAAPRASDTNGAGQHGDGGIDLRTQAIIWEGPSVAVTNGTRLTRSGDRSDELLLTGQAHEAAKRWSSPKASDPEKAGPNMRGSKGDVPLPGQAAQWMTPMTADDGRKVTLATKQYSLIQQSNDFFRPQSFPAPAIAAGAISLTDFPNTSQPSVKRKLNPIFVEALMRWPTGLSGFERPATAWTHWWQQQRSFLSALASASSEIEQMDLFSA